MKFGELSVMLLVGSACSALCQGTITFGNNLPDLKAPIFGPELDWGNHGGDWANAKSGNTPTNLPAGNAAYNGWPLESFLVSIATLRRTDLRPRLNLIRVPVMGMYGDRDNIVHPRQWQPLQAGVAQAQIVRYPKAGHFIMLDDPQHFQRSLKEFLDTPLENK